MRAKQIELLPTFNTQKMEGTEKMDWNGLEEGRDIKKRR